MLFLSCAVIFFIEKNFLEVILTVLLLTNSGSLIIQKAALAKTKISDMKNSRFLFINRIIAI